MSCLYLFDTDQTKNAYKIGFCTDVAKSFNDHFVVFGSALRLVAYSSISLDALPSTHSRVMDSVQQYRIRGERYQRLLLAPSDLDAVLALVASSGAPATAAECVLASVAKASSRVVSEPSAPSVASTYDHDNNTASWCGIF